MFSKFIWILAEKHLMVFGAKIHSHVYGFASMACHGTKIIFLARKEKEKTPSASAYHFFRLPDFYKITLAKVEKKIGLSLRHTSKFLSSKEAARVNLVTLKVL